MRKVLETLALSAALLLPVGQRATTEESIKNKPKIDNQFSLNIGGSLRL